MAADRSRLAAALAYKQAEEERRRRMLESIPTPAGTTPAQPAPQADFRTNLENLSIGLGEGLTNQLEGIKGIVTDPVGTAKGVYEAGKAVVRDPAIIASALRQMGQKAMSGPLGAGEVIGEMLGPRKTGPVMAELDVYHGTPHRFPATEANPLGEFDASKIGTGEGAQAYGHGVYLAESPGVAESYKKVLTDKKSADLWTDELRQQLPKSLTKKEFERFSDLNVKLSKNGNLSSQEMEEWRNFKDLQQKYDDAVGRLQPRGSLYKADLPDKMIDRMLDWDKPLSEQPAAVREAIETRVRHSNSSRKFLSTNPTGEQLYDMFSDRGDHRNPIEAAATFKEAGIPGIKYADAGSRGQGGSGTRNFVVFPGEEKKVRILERDGQKAPPQKIAQALEAIKPVKAQAKAGGEIAESNGYFYKGGQFLPSTEAEPGRWKIGKKVVTTKQEVIAPGEMAVQPTPFSRSIYQAALGQGDWVTKTPEGLKVRENIKTSTGEPITPDMKIRLGVKGVLGKEELTLQEFVDAYNKGQRWFDVQPDARVVRSK